MIIGEVAMAALRPCPSARVALAPSASVASRIGCSSRRRTLPVLSLRRRGGLTLKHVICANKDAAGQPNQPDPEEDESKTVSSKEILEELEKFTEEYAAKLGISYQEDDDMSNFMFDDDERKIVENIWEMVSSKSSILHVEATLTSVELCNQASQALWLASEVMYHASYRRLGHPSEFSMKKIEQTVRMHTSIFVKTAQDTYHGKLKMATICSFLGALGGLAAISHILLENTLDTVNDILLKHSKPKHSPCVDVETIRHEFEQKLNNLKQKVKTMASPVEREPCKIVNQAVFPAIGHVREFVHLMVSLRDVALDQAPDEYKWWVSNSNRP